MGKRGFTLIELVVSIGLFSTLMLLSTGSVLSMLTASQKARNTRIAVDNVSAAIDYMSREIRLGAMFHCEVGGSLTSPITDPQPCSYSTGGGEYLAFERAGGDPSLVAVPPKLGPGDQLIFSRAVDPADPTNTRHIIQASNDSGVTFSPLTSSGMDIQVLKFYVDGVNYPVAGGDGNQPRITILIKGVAGADKIKTQSAFTLQTTLTARTPNITP